MTPKGVLIGLTLFLLPLYAFGEVRQVEDHDTLCTLLFGKQDKNLRFVASTPMRDACMIENHKSRERVCEHNYQKKEIIAACIATYDAVAKQVEDAKAYNKSLQPNADASAE